MPHHNWEAWPPDYQQLLFDLIDEKIPGWAWDIPFDVAVRDIPIAPLIDAVFEELIEHWDEDDYSQCANYAEWLATSEPPPIIVDGDDAGLLRDGYHRVFAARIAGRKTLPAIRIDQLITALRNL